ncbi:peptidase associated/transthyretin-like domain-containing protein [Emticicia fontis]
MKAKFYKVFIFFLFSVSSFSQTNFWTISGNVTDDKKTVVQFVKVFVNNTTIGTSTNDKGNFQLNIPDKFSQVELIVSIAGYKSIKRKINYSSEIQVFRFQLAGNDILKEDIITTKHDKDFENKWKVFEHALLGDSKFAKDCEILNPEVIRLEYNKDKKVIANANEPVLIKNYALGYKILFQMDKFESDGLTLDLSGQKFFEKLNPNNISLKKKWDKNQKDVFSDSFRNFLMVLTRNKLEENDFEVFKRTYIKTLDDGQKTLTSEVKNGVLVPVNANAICTYDKDVESFSLHSEYSLLVFVKKRIDSKPLYTDYPYKYTEIVLPKGSARFTDNGWLTRPNGVILKEFWSFGGLATQLPYDYNIEGSENETIDQHHSIKLSKTDN